MPEATEAQRRARLASFGLGIKNAETPAGDLSGGEKARLLFSLIGFHKPHLLVLDEPANHLDIDSRAELIRSLNNYEGAVVVISHDRNLLEAVVDRLWLIDSGKVERFEGSLEDYRHLQLEKTKTDKKQTSKPDNSRKRNRQERAESLKKIAPLKKKTEKLEAQFEAAQAKLVQIDTRLSSEDLFTTNPDEAVTFGVMLNARLIRKQDAVLHYEVMAYLIKTFGPPPCQSPARTNPNLETLAWTDSDPRTVFDWAEEQFVLLKSHCHMKSFNSALFPLCEDLELHRIAGNRRLDALAAGQIPYITTPTQTILYDPSDCAQPGYFAATIILNLARERVAQFKSEIPLTPLRQKLITLTAAAYHGQGFALTSLSPQLLECLTSGEHRRAISQRMIENALCFCTCLTLRIQHKASAQILAIPSTQASKTLHKKIRLACRQIDAEPEMLKILRILADPNPTRNGITVARQRWA